MIDILADESVDYQLVVELRKSGFNIESILEKSPGISDDEVLNIAFTNKALLLTEDKDFGELIIRLKKPTFGVLLIRFSGNDLELKSKLLITQLRNYSNKLWNSFSVISNKKIRIRRVK